MATSTSTKGYLASSLQCKCPRCREGELFQNPLRLSIKGNLAMHKTCPVCGQPTEIEVGFYYGTGYVSYALTVALTVSTLVAWWVLIGFSTEDNRFFWWLGSNAVLLILLQPWLMRISRSLWISWFVSYDPDWASNKLSEVDFERINKDQSGNW
ncbi:MAG: DUF983 domain-containing protein [Bacteroidetes bacterium]|nr:DUF983 domain-containing protein [Bacteroidota bacterium]